MKKTFGTHAFTFVPFIKRIGICMSNEYSIKKSGLNGNPESYVAAVNNSRKMSIEQVVDEIAIPGSILKKPELLAMIHVFFEVLAKNINKGKETKVALIMYNMLTQLIFMVPALPKAFNYFEYLLFSMNYPDPQLYYNIKLKYVSPAECSECRGPLITSTPSQRPLLPQIPA